jgi:3-(3-hydroxy-phenyl)propionate hydroxylase
MNNEYDVIIVGLGPTGAVLAAMLGNAEIGTLVLERDTQVYPLPRAVHFDDEVMRIFQGVGIADEVLQCAQPTTGYEFRNGSGEVLMRFSDGAVMTASGWHSGYMCHQPTIENALRKKLAGQMFVDVRLGSTFLQHVAYADHIIVEYEDNAGQQKAKASFLIACDGASSPVRTQAEIELDDLNFDEPWLVIDALVSDPSRLPHDNLQICDPKRPTTCVNIGHGRHRWEFMLLPGETAEQVSEDAFILQLLEPWNCADVVEIERKAVYRFHGLVAQQWRKGPLILAGDAAHQMPPFAGQGMCSGIRDAANLSWKLEAILKGGSPDTLLDSYQPEREPNVRAYIGLAIGMGQIVCIQDEAAAAQRDAAMIAMRDAGGEPMQPPPLPPLTIVVDGVDPPVGTRFIQPTAHGKRMDDVLGNGPALIARDVVATAMPVHVLDDPQLAPYRDRLSEWLDMYDVEAVLIRPDRYIFGVGEAEKLAEAYQQALA